MASHAIIHVEIPARDLEACADFYEKLLGWKINRSPEYVAFRPESGPGGGFNPLADESSGQKVLIKPGDVIIYIDTEDIDQTLGLAVALGGQVIIGRTEISGAGGLRSSSIPPVIASGCCISTRLSHRRLRHPDRAATCRIRATRLTLNQQGNGPFCSYPRLANISHLGRAYQQTAQPSLIPPGIRPGKRGRYASPIRL